VLTFENFCQKLCACYEGVIDQLHLGSHSPAVRRGLSTLDLPDTISQDCSFSAENRAATHPLGSGFNDPAPLAMSAAPGAAPGKAAHARCGLDGSGDDSSNVNVTSDFARASELQHELARSRQGTGLEAVAAEEESLLQESAQNSAARDSGRDSAGSEARPASIAEMGLLMALVCQAHILKKKKYLT
jgi:hypothetical protein